MSPGNDEAALPLLKDGPIHHEFVDVGAVKLHVVSQGAGDPVLLLHGFPEFWYSWRHQLASLAQAGYQAVAPDLRGFNTSDKPSTLDDYRIDSLTADVRGLIFHLCADRPVKKVRLVGHDWGGTLAWHIAAQHPDLVDRLVIMNSPHPRLMRERLRTWPQRLKSWYMHFFALPLLPERIVTTHFFMRKAMADTAVNKASFTRADVEAFVNAMRQRGAATATLNWYRAALRFPGPALPRVRARTLVIWGEKDRVLGKELLDGLEDEVDSLRIERLPNASHWVQQDCPEEVSALLLSFLAEPDFESAVLGGGEA